VDAAARELDAVRLAWPADAGDAVRGAFDRKCMRRYASAAPIKPRALLAGADAAAALERMARDLRDVLRALFAAGSAEHAAYAFQALALRAPAPLPFVRSAAATAFLGDACVRGREPLDAFVRRAVLEAAPAPAAALASLLRNDGARVVADWLRTQCQNAPRQRRVALKYLGGWDALQAACEQADAQTHADAFCTASWAYHMKLQLLAAALLGGVRMRVYADHELPALFCCAAHALDAHVALLDRMRAHASPERAARLRRWRALASAQHALAQAQWLVAHALERLRVFRAPWWPRPGDASRLAACARLEGTRARRARFALRFRALAALGSPPPLTFDAWCAAQQQLDACPLAELFDHAARTLARARDALERERRLRHDDASPVAAAWDQACEPLARVMVANAVALA
ncbi:N-alpha-acetyltransferase, non-catalitic subunit, partial [Coemansia sp. Cherry 401B]